MESIHYGVSCDHCKAFPLKGDRYKCTVCPNKDVCGTCLKKHGTCPDCKSDLCWIYGIKNISGWANGKCKRCAKNCDYCICTGKNTRWWVSGKCQCCAKNSDYCICSNASKNLSCWNAGKCTRCAKNVDYCICANQEKEISGWNAGKCTRCGKNVDYCIC